MTPWNDVRTDSVPDSSRSKFREEKKGKKKRKGKKKEKEIQKTGSGSANFLLHWRFLLMFEQKWECVQEEGGMNTLRIGPSKLSTFSIQSTLSKRTLSKPDTSLKQTVALVPRVSVLERVDCIQHKWIVLLVRFDWFFNFGISPPGGFQRKKITREPHFIRK